LYTKLILLAKLLIFILPERKTRLPVYLNDRQIFVIYCLRNIGLI